MKVFKSVFYFRKEVKSNYEYFIFTILHSLMVTPKVHMITIEPIFD